MNACVISLVGIYGFFHELQTNAVVLLQIVLLQISNRKKRNVNPSPNPFQSPFTTRRGYGGGILPPSTGGKYIASKGFIMIYWRRTTTIADRFICFCKF